MDYFPINLCRGTLHETKKEAGTAMCKNDYDAFDVYPTGLSLNAIKLEQKRYL